MVRRRFKNCNRTRCPLVCILLLYRVVLFRDEADVSNAGIVLGGKPVDWSSPEGRALMNLLIPSADMINFRIAHEVAHLRKRDSWWEVVISPVFFATGYNLAVIICRSKFISLTHSVNLEVLHANLHHGLDLSQIESHW